MAEKQRQLIRCRAANTVSAVGRRIDHRYRLTPDTKNGCVSPKKSSDMAKAHAILGFRRRIRNNSPAEIAARRFVPIYLLMA